MALIRFLTPLSPSAGNMTTITRPGSLAAAGSPKASIQADRWTTVSIRTTTKAGRSSRSPRCQHLLYFAALCL